jgi:hypothetical protein
MKAPELSQLSQKEPLYKVAFWFDYWNSQFPIPGLRMEFSDTGYIESFSAFANTEDKTTVFNKAKFATVSDYHGSTTARHEHVHQLLGFYGYPTAHKLMFALVDNALVYAFEQTRSAKKLEDALKVSHSYSKEKLAGYLNASNSISHYDFHEDDCIVRGINTRLFFLLAKRLARHADNIETLLATAERYSEYLNETTPDKKSVRRYERYIDYLHGAKHEILEGWGNAEKKSKREISSLTEKLAQAREDNRYLNSLNMRWQGAFVLTAAIAVSLLVKVMA